MQETLCLAYTDSAASGKLTGVCHDNATGSGNYYFRYARNSRACRPTPLAISVFTQLLIYTCSEDFQSKEYSSLIKLYKTAYDYRDAFNAILARRDTTALTISVNIGT